MRRVLIGLVLGAALAACGGTRQGVDVPVSDPGLVDVSQVKLLANEHDIVNDANSFGFLESFDSFNAIGPAGSGAPEASIRGSGSFRYVQGTVSGASACTSGGSCWIISTVGSATAPFVVCQAGAGSGRDLKLRPAVGVEANNVGSLWPAAWSNGGAQWTGNTYSGNSGNDPATWNATFNNMACVWSDTNQTVTPTLVYAASFDSTFDFTSHIPLLWVEIQFTSSRGIFPRKYRQVMPMTWTQSF